MNPMICSSVNLLLFTSAILLVDGLLGIYSGTAGRGQVKLRSPAQAGPNCKFHLDTTSLLTL